MKRLLVAATLFVPLLASGQSYGNSSSNSGLWIFALVLAVLIGLFLLSHLKLTTDYKYVLVRPRGSTIILVLGAFLAACMLLFAPVSFLFLAIFWPYSVFPLSIAGIYVLIKAVRKAPEDPRK